MVVEALNNCNTNGDDCPANGLNDADEKKEHDSHMNSRFIAEVKENEDNSIDMDDKSTDCESMNEEEEHDSYEHEHQKDKAVEQLSVVFRLLKIELIHDKCVANLCELSEITRMFRLAVSSIRMKVDEVYRKVH
jgi:hypothetical protein